MHGYEQIVVTFMIPKYKEIEMDATRVKQKIHEYVDRADDRFLNLVHSMIEADEISIIGYRPDGTPISKENLVARTRISAQQIADGQTISSEDFKKDFEKWKKKKRTNTK